MVCPTLPGQQDPHAPAALQRADTLRRSAQAVAPRSPIERLPLPFLAIRCRNDVVANSWTGQKQRPTRRQAVWVDRVHRAACGTEQDHHATAQSGKANGKRVPPSAVVCDMYAKPIDQVLNP